MKSNISLVELHSSVLTYLENKGLTFVSLTCGENSFILTFQSKKGTLQEVKSNKNNLKDLLFDFFPS